MTLHFSIRQWRTNVPRHFHYYYLLYGRKQSILDCMAIRVKLESTNTIPPLPPPPLFVADDGNSVKSCFPYTALAPTVWTRTPTVINQAGAVRTSPQNQQWNWTTYDCSSSNTKSKTKQVWPCWLLMKKSTNVVICIETLWVYMYYIVWSVWKNILECLTKQYKIFDRKVWRFIRAA